MPEATADAVIAHLRGGPRTAAGKLRSLRNVLTHGLRARRLVLLDDEKTAEFRAFPRALQAELEPEGRLQADLVSRIVIAAWRARRTPLRTDLGGRCREPGARSLAALKLLQAEARGPSGAPRELPAAGTKRTREDLAEQSIG
jgi:hypothetical protein